MVISKNRALSLTKRAIHNYLFKKPLCVSFEVTHSCNANCKHCHLGGRVKENKTSPDRFGEICRTLNPVIAQVSGGEPLMREDLEDIIKAFKRPNRAPYIDITTNGILLTKERYEKLLRAGIDQIGLSLDYPDNRHDTFRGFPGLFNRIEKLIKELDGVKDKAITLICVIHSENYKDLIKMVELCNDWKIKINFTIYTWLRTNNKGLLLNKQQIKEFRGIVAELMERNKKYKSIFTSQYIFDGMIKFFENHSMPHCQTGTRFFNVNPDGTLSPCGLIIKNYDSQKELLEKFSRHNSCTFCYTSIRANAEKPIYHLFNDNFKFFK